MLEVKNKIESRCGIECDKCKYKLESICEGCLNINKPFWGESCPLKSCVENKKISCCGNCDSFPCEVLKEFSYDEKEGDNGKRINNCRNWCKNK